jgi:hypothetical protein
MGLKDVIVTEGDEIVWHDGAFVGGAPEIAGGSESPDYVTFEVGSGSYRFESSGTPA